MASDLSSLEQQLEKIHKLVRDNNKELGDTNALKEENKTLNDKINALKEENETLKENVNKINALKEENETLKQQIFVKEKISELDEKLCGIRKGLEKICGLLDKMELFKPNDPVEFVATVKGGKLILSSPDESHNIPPEPCDEMSFKDTFDSPEISGEVNIFKHFCINSDDDDNDFPDITAWQGFHSNDSDNEQDDWRMQLGL
jgi:hypothetical protein